MAAMLDDLGYKVFEAGSAPQALAILRRETAIDLVITDHAMPQMTGLSSSERLKPNGRTCWSFWPPDTEMAGGVSAGLSLYE